jgi:FKBP-type peptidyl-prolyl cis-trans isomerase SlyD
VRIDPGTVVTLEYEVRDCDGAPLEKAGAELAYLHGGFGEIFPKVESALSGKQPGDEVNLTLEPEDAFGEYDAELLRVEPRDRFPEKLDVGMQFEGIPGDDVEATLIYTVTDVTADAVVVDGNHPWAGERLWIRCAVKDVRRASSEEISAGGASVDAGLSTR